MKILVKERDVNYYDELLYICTFSKKIVNKPTSKVRKLSKYYKNYCIVFAILLFIFYIDVLVTGNDIFDMCMFFSCFLFLCITIKGVFQTKNLLKQYVSMDGDGFFEINDDVLSIQKSDGSLMSVKWDSVRYIILNKYSIVFVPKDNVGVLLSISVKYSDEVLKIIDKYNKNELVIDNRKLYK